MSDKSHYEKKLDDVFAALGLTFNKDKECLIKFQKRFNRLLDKVNIHMNQMAIKKGNVE